MLRLFRAVPQLLRAARRADRAEGPAATEAPILSGAWPTYSRFALALVREPVEAPYGDLVADRPSAVVPLLHRLLHREPYECLGALLLTTHDRLIGHTIPFRGTIRACRVEPRPLLLAAMATNAVGILVFHNHPSGDPTPSPEDRSFARRLREAGHVVGVEIRDFLVLGEPPTFCSLRAGSSVPVPAALRRRKRKPKFRHPGDPALTWVGTGRMPVWLRGEIEHGATLQDFLVPGAVVTEYTARLERQVRERVRREEGGQE